MSITKEDIEIVEQAKQAIEDALANVVEAVRGSNNRAQFDAYIKGALEQACENVTGFGGYSLEELITDMNGEVEDNLLELAISIGQDDAMDDEDHLKDRLEYYTNREGDESEEERTKQINGLNILIEACEE